MVNGNFQFQWQFQFQFPNPNFKAVNGVLKVYPTICHADKHLIYFHEKSNSCFSLQSVIFTSGKRSFQDDKHCCESGVFSCFVFTFHTIMRYGNSKFNFKFKT